MSILITFIKLLAVFDLLVIAVYFGSDILSTVWSKFRKKPTREEPFDFSLDAAAVPLSIDSIRQLYSGDAADFVEETLLPDSSAPTGSPLFGVRPLADNSLCSTAFSVHWIDNF